MFGGHDLRPPPPPSDEVTLQAQLAAAAELMFPNQVKTTHSRILSCAFLIFFAVLIVFLEFPPGYGPQGYGSARYGSPRNVPRAVRRAGQLHDEPAPTPAASHGNRWVDALWRPKRLHGSQGSHHSSHGPATGRVRFQAKFWFRYGTHDSSQIPTGARTGTPADATSVAQFCPVPQEQESLLTGNRRHVNCYQC